MRCRSWRITKEPHHPLHRPGACDLCWEPCHNRVDTSMNGGKRCRSCWDDLTKVSMTDTTLALSLLKESQVPEFVIDRLEMSDVFVIAQAASARRSLVVGS
jgi:hypothetical protein